MSAVLCLSACNEAENGASSGTASGTPSGTVSGTTSGTASGTPSGTEHIHSYVDFVVAPTCLTDGYTIHKCSCGEESKDTIISALGHNFTTYSSDNNSSCTKDGTKTAKCTRCDATDTTVEDNSKKPHSYVDKVVAPTCTADGYTTHKCSTCGTEYTDATVPALGHTEVIDPAKAATCTETGLTEGKHCSVCNTVIVAQTTTEKVAHTPSDWVSDATINCLTTREKHKICTVCNAILEVSTAAPETKHNFVGGKCTRCIATIYTRSGNIISFGSYPQTKVTDATLTATLTESAGTLPTTDNNQAWTSYGYYKSGSTANYMWYIDKAYNGEKYRGVYFTEYRPYGTSLSADSNYSVQDDNGYKINNVYWFKYDPIQWKILSETNGVALIKCITAIDGQQYDASASNNYKNSDIRKWLNETFYEQAFDSLQKELIQTTIVDNSLVSANANNNALYYNNGVNNYVCEDTEDKIFLLSANDVSNTAYGFKENLGGSDSGRTIGASDYAFAQGIYKYYKGCVEWLLRSPYYQYNYENIYINESGLACDDRNVRRIMGVVPTMYIKL